MMPVDVSEAPDLTRVRGSAPEDVTANEERRLSPTQRRDLLNGLSVKALLATLFWVLTTGLFGANVWVGVVCGLLGLALSVALAIDLLAASGHEVRHRDGSVWVQRIADEDGTSYRVHVAGLRLGARPDLGEALPAGGPYRVYYLRRHRRALGARPLPGWRPATPVSFAVRSELGAVVRKALGNRSDRVVEALERAPSSLPDLEAAIDAIPDIRVVFVDRSRLETLAAELRTALHRYVGG